jgi:hypothetical protein
VVGRDGCSKRVSWPADDPVSGLFLWDWTSGAAKSVPRDDDMVLVFGRGGVGRLCGRGCAEAKKSLICGVAERDAIF